MPNKQCKPGGMYEHWTDDVDSFASPLIALDYLLWHLQTFMHYKKTLKV
jgi:hypothetical protein